MPPGRRIVASFKNGAPQSLTVASDLEAAATGRGPCALEIAATKVGACHSDSEAGGQQLCLCGWPASEKLLGFSALGFPDQACRLLGPQSRTCQCNSRTRRPIIIPIWVQSAPPTGFRPRLESTAT
jgi:hypothetical protein